MSTQVLLVEDNLSLAETVIAYFGLEDIECDHAATGPQGLELALNTEYQAILPSGERRLKLIICFNIVGCVIPGRSKIFGN